MKKNKNVIILVVLSMLLPLAFLIVSIVVYEDETPWEGFLYSAKDKGLGHRILDDFHTKEACLNTMENVIQEERKRDSQAQYMCGKKCFNPNETGSSFLSEYKCEEKYPK